MQILRNRLLLMNKWFAGCDNVKLCELHKNNIIIFHAIYDPRFSRSVNWAVFGVSWWRHQMETFSALLALCAGNSPVTGEFPSQRPVTWSFVVFFDLRRNNGWVINRYDGDLRLHRAHHNVTVMSSSARIGRQSMPTECDITILWCTAHNTTD